MGIRVDRGYMTIVTVNGTEEVGEYESELFYQILYLKDFKIL